ncbi:MaoC family dehydratase [Streptoalloteichus hindustanus]|uniref:MaoC like domain-containing protein n=1 Tax=Streptoalloteichus hindustanus TaxID=2017 RepID=A0A1M4UKC4_STRHI|nr:MaoC/PaaZ C-terminal domain-containing protein [Streptoalloteichus hindustanus]SHE57186.1 MaoC like domain-containing protein [Streptoalloteichus hindustanus]
MTTTTHALAAPPDLGALYRRAVLSGLSGFLRRGGDLPNTTLELPAVTTDVEHLGAYARVCGFRLRDELPATYPHVLAFPLSVQLMADPSFPFPLPGLVHVRNQITQFRPLMVDEVFALRVRMADLRPHERGQQFDVVAEAVVAHQVVWRDVSTYLRRTGGRGGPRGDVRREAPEPSGLWRVPADVGLRYAAVSGDRNPIHLNRFAARAFGFPRAIAHGMWTKARCLTAFEGRLPDALLVDVHFRAPVPLPSRVAFSAHADASGWLFALHDPRRGKPHLTGSINLI